MYFFTAFGLWLRAAVAAPVFAWTAYIAGLEFHYDLLAYVYPVVIAPIRWYLTPLEGIYAEPTSAKQARHIQATSF